MDKLSDIAPCGIFSFSDEGTIEDVNAAFCALLGYTREELVHHSIDTIFTISTRIFYQTHFSLILKLKGAADEVFLSLLTKLKTEVSVLLNGKRITEDDKAVTICACIALYHRKKFEDELISAKKQAEAALHENAALLSTKEELQKHAEALDQKLVQLQQRNDDLLQLNNIITHDLQEPLRKLQVFADLLLSEKSTAYDNERTAMVLNRIIDVSHNMKTMLRGLQQYTWLDNKHAPVKEVDLNKLLLVVQQRVALEFKDEPYQLTINELPVIEGYWDQLVILFYQLISNSIKFKHKDRKVIITLTGVTIQQNKFKSLQDKYQYVDYLKLQYSDNSSGFDEKFNSQVFELLRKLDKNSEGLGIGLALCKKVVDNHRGSITAVSKEGEGVQFNILLPLQQS